MSVCVFISSSGTWYVDNPLFLACPTNSEMSSTSLSPSEVVRTVAKQEKLMCQMLTEARKNFHLFPLVFSPVDTYWNIANCSLWFFRGLISIWKVNGALSRFLGKTEKLQKRRASNVERRPLRSSRPYFNSYQLLEMVLLNMSAIMCKFVQIIRIVLYPVKWKL